MRRDPEPVPSLTRTSNASLLISHGAPDGVSCAWWLKTWGHPFTSTLVGFPIPHGQVPRTDDKISPAKSPTPTSRQLLWDFTLYVYARSIHRTHITRHPVAAFELVTPPNRRDRSPKPPSSSAERTPFLAEAFTKKDGPRAVFFA